MNSLIYRMLVLNTGQVPWELARQLETVYSQFLKQITAELGQQGVSIFLRDEQRRRTAAAQYHASSIVELLLVFSSRKPDVEVRDRVAEDFARLDAIETTSHTEFLEYYIRSLQCLVTLDRAFSRLADRRNENGRVEGGRDIFARFPAMAGFLAATSVQLFDEPGFPIEWSKAPERMFEIERSSGALSDRLEHMDQEQLAAFLQLDVLQETFSGRRGGVGRFERDFFRRAFTALLKFADRLESMEPCWRA